MIFFRFMKVCIKKVAYLSIFFLYCSAYLLFSQVNSIKRFVINPLNRVTIYCDNIPKNFTSDYDESKNSVLIAFEGNSIKFPKDTTRGEGIVDYVFAKNIGNAIQIEIKLKAKRGYSVVPLEFSKAIMVEVFDWNSLSPAEDNYRMGQLALLHNLAVARHYFEKAYEQNLGNSGFFLGFLYLKAGNFRKAEEVLRKANLLGCNIADLNAALAQAYDYLGDKNLSAKFRNLFLQNTYGISYAPIETDSSLVDSIFKQIESDLVIEEDTGFPKVENFDKAFADTTEKFQDTSSIASETSIDKTSNIVKRILYGFLVALLFFFVVLLVLFYKWRKIKTTGVRFQEQLREEAKNIEAEQNRTESQAQATQQDKPINYLNPKVKELAQEIIEIKRKELEQTEEEIPNEELSNKEDIVEAKTITKSPRLEIARQIQREQEEILRKKLQSLELKIDNLNPEKLKELAEQLGIPKSSLLAKINVDSVSKDKKLIDKLKSKFLKKE